MTAKEDGAAKTVATIEDSIESGFTLAETVRMLLDDTFAALAKQSGLNPTEFTMCLLGYPDRKLTKVRRVLARKLGLTHTVMSNLIDEYCHHNTGK